MREISRSNNIILFAVVLTALVMAMLLLEPNFFDRGDRNIYTNIGNNWHEIDLGAFSVRTPVEFRYFKQQGTDSYVGLITNSHDTIYFDYGWYSNDLTDSEFLRSYDTINGVPSITAYSISGEVGVHFPVARKDYKLTLYSSTLGKELGFKIFRTIDLNGRSGRTTEVLGNNIVAKGFSKGEQLFKQNCIYCHGLNEMIIGPQLQNIVERTSKEWFVNWIRNPNELIQTNKQAAELFREFEEIRHPRFSFTNEDIDALIEFTEQQKE